MNKLLELADVVVEATKTYCLFQTPENYLSMKRAVLLYERVKHVINNSSNVPLSYNIHFPYKRGTHESLYDRELPQDHEEDR